MGNSWNTTIFTSGSGGGGGGSSGDYVKDSFEDYSLPATDNSGLTSTALTNPLTQFFNNNDSPKYSVKTLWIKNFKLIQDTTKWIDNKPTYIIEWNEDFPGAFGYVVGNARLVNSTQGISINLRNINDIFGVSGVIRKCAFICNPLTSTGTADIVIDGVDTGSDATFGGAGANVVSDGYNSFNAILASASNQTDDIHDYRLTVNETYSLTVAGVIVYYENTTSDIEFFPGSTYIDKTKQTTTSSVAEALPTITGAKGAKTLLYKTSVAGYDSNTLATPTIFTLATGSSGTNSLSVTTGHGASFPIGTGIVSFAGTSFYVGTVTNVSTDTLTVGPTLPFGLAGATMYDAWHAGPTLAISSTLYKLAYTFDPALSNVPADPNGFGVATSGDFYFSDPYKRFRIWGDQLAYTFQDGTPVVQFNGNTVGFLQVDGRFAAAEIEWASTPGISAVLHGTFGINGVAGCYGINEGFTGILKKTVFTDAGPGWKSFVFSPGQTYINVGIGRINFYERQNLGVTQGLLSAFDTYENAAPRGAINATLFQLGTHQRVFADELYMSGSWTRGTTTTMPGGAYFAGSSTNSVLSFQYYGTDYALIGTAGATALLTFDGASTSLVFNAIKSVATLGFHTITLTPQNGTTSVIAALDYVRPRDELKNLQNFSYDDELATIPTVYQQGGTPRSPKAGDLWIKSPGSVWVYLLGLWNKISIVQTSDDPNIGTFVTSHGSTSTSASNGNSNGEQSNLISWSAIVASGVARSSMCNNGNGEYTGKHHVIDGNNTSSSVTAYFAAYNRSSWSTLTNRGSPLSFGNCANAFGFLWSSQGTTDNTAANSTNNGYKWNGSSWATSGTNWGTARYRSGAFTIQERTYALRGNDTSDSTTGNTISRTSADSISTEAVCPIIGPAHGTGNGPSGLGVTVSASSTGSTASNNFNGTSWSGNVAMTFTMDNGTGNGGGLIAGANSCVLAGASQNSVVVTDVQMFNGVNWVRLNQKTNSQILGGSSGL